MVDGVAHSLLLPVEPHMWIAAALLVKNTKVQRYRTRTGAAYVALLLHSTSMFDLGAYESCKDFYVTALVHGLQSSEVNFDAVLFADEHSKAVQLLSDKTSPFKLSVASQQKMRLLSLPILRYW